MPAVGLDQHVECIPGLDQVRDVDVDPVALAHHRRERLLGDAQVTREFIEELRTQYGLDQPLYWQLLIYLGRIAQGDLGYSFISRDSVSAIILSRLPATLLLLGSQFVLSIIIGMAG